MPQVKFNYRIQYTLLAGNQYFGSLVLDVDHLLGEMIEDEDNVKEAVAANEQVAVDDVEWARISWQLLGVSGLPITPPNTKGRGELDA